MIHRPLRYYYLKIVRQRDSPEQIAAGAALGLFIGLTLPPGTHVIVAVLLATFFNMSRVSAFCATWITNPLTFAIIYPVQFYIGSRLTGIPLKGMIPRNWEDAWSFVTNLQQSGQAILVLAVGAIATALPMALIGYHVTRAVVVSFRARKSRRAALRAARRPSNTPA